MSIYQNQTFKKKITYVKNTDDDKSVTFSISVQTNHELDKDVLASIEQNINSLFIHDYVDLETLKKEAMLQDELNKELMKQEKEQLKQEKEQLKNEKERLKYEKQRYKESQADEQRFQREREADRNKRRNNKKR
jgi:hypothetical protein